MVRSSWGTSLLSLTSPECKQPEEREGSAWRWREEAGVRKKRRGSSQQRQWSGGCWQFLLAETCSVLWAASVPADGISLLCSSASLSNCTQGSSQLLPRLPLPAPGEQMLQATRLPYAHCNWDRFGAAEPLSPPALPSAGPGCGQGRHGELLGRGAGFAFSLLRCPLTYGAAFLPATRWHELLL